MNDRQLRYAFTVWRERSFSRAARKLDVSQPTVSDQIRLIEEELGFALFHRGPRGVEASTAGELFLVRVEQVLHDFANLHSLGKQLSDGADTRLRIGVSPFVPDQAVAALVAELLRRQPNARFELISGINRRLVRLLDQGRLDMMLLLGADSSTIERYEVVNYGSIPLDVLGSEAQLGTAVDSLSLPALATLPLILSDRQSGLGMKLLSHFEACSLTPNVVAECDDESAARALLKVAVGCIILPSPIADRMLGLHNVSRRRIDHDLADLMLAFERSKASRFSDWPRLELAS